MVDDEGEEIFADKIGLMLARDLSRPAQGATFVVDVKSTGLFATDPVLKANGATTVYWKTGHSYIKRKTAELGALAGFEKSGHFFFKAPIGPRLRLRHRRRPRRSWPCSTATRARSSSDLKKALPVAYTSLTMRPHCADEVKYGVVDDVVAEYTGAARRRRHRSWGAGSTR